MKIDDQSNLGIGCVIDIRSLIRVTGLCTLALVAIAGPGYGIQVGLTSKSKPSTHPEPRQGEIGARKIEIDDETRVYRLVVPKTVDLAKPVALVVAFHGMLIDSKDLMPKYTRLNETA
ncbi:MAG: hypothetical protein SFV81_17845, partial [Pirellulaceae bacterium]|nr:hypothetical protein [Pirellulaceae bacterium]